MCNYSLQGVSKRSEQFEKDSKLKSMKYLVKILFYLDKLVSCLPPVTKSLVHQVNENPNRFEINLAVTSSCEVTISLHEVRGQLLCMCDLQLCFDL